MNVYRNVNWERTIDIELLIRYDQHGHRRIGQTEADGKLGLFQHGATVQGSDLPARG